MPIYIVRWHNPGPAACLIRAPNKAEAASLVDAIIEDPNCCEIKEYRGFLLVNIDLDIKSHQEEIDESIVPHTVVDDVSECLDGLKMIISLDAETTLDILKIAFPHYDDYFDRHCEEIGDEKATTDECKKAIQQDFDDMERKIRAKLEPALKSAVDQAEDILREVK